MSPQEFAQKIKAKYPQYNEVDDTTLAQKMVEKYPQYASKVKFEQQPLEQPNREQPKLGTWEGFIDPFKQTGIGIAKGAGKLALGVGTLGRGIQKAITPKALEGQMLGGESMFDTGSAKRQAADEALKADTTGQSIGSFATEVGATMLPSGGAYKATKGLGFLTRMLGRGGTGAVVGTVQGGGDIDRDTAIGAAAETIIPGAVSQTFKVGGGILKRLASIGGGTGTDVIEQVLKTPKAALAASKMDDVTALKGTATAIRSGIKTLRQKAGQEFDTLTSKITKPLDGNKLKDSALKYIDELEGSSFKVDAGDMNKLRNVVKGWEDYSPKGINGLASRISEFYSGSANAVPEDRIVSGLNRMIRDWVGKQVPEIAEANAKYADKMDLIEQMNAIFKLKGATDSRIGLQNTATAVSRLFNANKNIARQGVEELEKEIGVDILGREAGRQLGAGAITKFQMADGATGVARSLIPQSAILKLTAATGMTKNAIESRLDTLEPAARATVIEVLTDLLGEGEGQDQPQTR